MGPRAQGAENPAPTGIRFLDRPVRSESLYRLSYRGRPNEGSLHRKCLRSVLIHNFFHLRLGRINNTCVYPSGLHPNRFTYCLFSPRVPDVLPISSNTIIKIISAEEDVVQSYLL